MEKIGRRHACGDGRHALGEPLFVSMVVLGSFTGASMGLLLGTLVPANRINIMFALIFTPLLFTGSSQYPWPSLDQLRWFQVVTTANPVTYVSEGMRAALVPRVPHMAPWICLIVLSTAVIVLGLGGISGFCRRAQD